MINDILYLEATAYRTLDFQTQNSLGVDPFSAPGLFDGVAPYWRIAVEPHWGNHWLMVGAFGMLANVNPWIGPGNPVGTTATFPQSDKFADVGIDSQYQYIGNYFQWSVRGSLIREYQRLDASFANGLSANPTNSLNTMRLQASLTLGRDNKMVLTTQYFQTWGTPDPILYAGLASASLFRKVYFLEGMPPTTATTEGVTGHLGMLRNCRWRHQDARVFSGGLEVLADGIKERTR
jgi:hypothetical protein